MQRDGGGIVTPDEFLPVAERFDLVQALDRWVVRQAIGLIAAAERSGRELVLEVNMSGRSIGDPALFELLERELRETGIDASKLVLEVTETAAIENMEVARSFANSLASLGCRLALDDFGSGFGSFYYLKHLPFDYLKIDGDFVRQLTQNRVDQAVVRSIVQIAAERRLRDGRRVRDRRGDARGGARVRRGLRAGLPHRRARAGGGARHQRGRRSPGRVRIKAEAGQLPAQLVEQR